MMETIFEEIEDDGGVSLNYSKISHFLEIWSNIQL